MEQFLTTTFFGIVNALNALFILIFKSCVSSKCRNEILLPQTL